MYARPVARWREGGPGEVPPPEAPARPGVVVLALEELAVDVAERLPQKDYGRQPRAWPQTIGAVMHAPGGHDCSPLAILYRKHTGVTGVREKESRVCETARVAAPPTGRAAPGSAQRSSFPRRRAPSGSARVESAMTSRKSPQRAVKRPVAPTHKRHTKRNYAGKHYM